VPLKRSAGEGVLPILKEQAGFQNHFGFVSELCEAVAITLFSDRKSAMAAHERVRAWIAANKRNVMPGTPEVRAGEVLYCNAVIPTLQR
jgi:hypothetical protein